MMDFSTQLSTIAKTFNPTEVSNFTNTYDEWAENKIGQWKTQSLIDAICGDDNEYAGTKIKCTHCGFTIFDEFEIEELMALQSMECPQCNKDQQHEPTTNQ